VHRILNGVATRLSTTPSIVRDAGGETVFGEEGQEMKADRKNWEPPKLMRKPVSETLQGVGTNQDGIGGEFPIQS